MTPISTERLLLRPFNVNDAEALWQILEKPRASCFADEKITSHADAVAEVLKRCKEPDGSQIAVCLQGQPAIMIGCLFGMEEDQNTWSIGWNFNQAFCGQGYAFEAARAYLDYLFKVKNARRLYAYTASDNTRSQKLCKKLGMRLEGILKEHISFIQDADGNPIYEDTCVFAILKKEWKTWCQFLLMVSQADICRNISDR